jgi:hypothetical protein
MRIDRTQRWQAGRQRWRRVDEGGFDPDRYTVAVVDHDAAVRFVRAHHYSQAWPSVTHRFGLFDHGADDAGELVGVIALGTPMSNAVLTNVFPSLVPNEESLEWSRLVLVDEVPANGESWFARRAFRLAAAADVRGVVTFADPVARWQRTDEGLVQIKPGHVGTVYQGLNMAYLGRATRRTRIILPDASELTDRALSKLRRRERGGPGVVRRLVGLGASEPAPEANLSEWLSASLATIGAYRQRHPGNHRYALRIGSRRQRSRTLIAMGLHSYPRAHGELALVA